MRPLIAAAALFLLSIALNFPLFSHGESPYRDSIAGGYAGMARFFAAHPDPLGWDPLQYAGLPTQFVYVPALPYASAIVSWVTGIDPTYAYKLLTAVMTCLGPVTLFVLVWYFTRSVGWALAAGVVYTFFSPLYGIVRQIDGDRGIIYLPWRIHVLTKYGEGPHNTGLALIPVALIALWRASVKFVFPRIVVAAVLLCAIALTNWVAALGTAIAVVLMLLSSREIKLVRITAVGLLAYALACWWLTPAFIGTIAFNWPKDAFNYQLAALQKLLLAGWFVGILALRIAAWILRWPFLATYAMLGTFAFGWPVLIFYAFGIDVLPESRRYALELEFFACLAFIAFLQFGFSSKTTVRRVCAAVLTLAMGIAGASQFRHYVTQGYAAWQPIPIEQTSEYRIAKWLNDQHPRGRVLATGGLRFRLNKYFDLEQVGGAFESGLKIRTPVDFAYQIRTLKNARAGREVADAIAQMQAFGVEYVVVHGPHSTEHYRDYQNPGMFEGVLERVYTDGDDWIYRVPFRSYAHAVRPGEQPTFPNRDFIGGLVSAINDEYRPKLSFQWLKPGVAEIRGRIPEGHDVDVAVTGEPGWAATQNGRRLWVDRNKLGHVVIKARPTDAESTIRLEYQSTAQQKFCGFVSAFAWTGMLTGLVRWRRS